MVGMYYIRVMLGTPYKITDPPARINGLSRYVTPRYDRRRSTRLECKEIKLISDLK